MFIKLFFYNSNIKNRKYNFLNNLCYNFQYYSIFFSFIFNFGLGSLQKIIFNSFINFLNILFHLLKKKLWNGWWKHYFLRYIVLWARIIFLPSYFFKKEKYLLMVKGNIVFIVFARDNYGILNWLRGMYIFF